MQTQTVDFDTSTVDGQRHPTDVSVGMDSEANIARPFKAKDPEAPEAAPRRTIHSYVGRSVSATWMGGRFGAATVGIIVKVDPVSDSDRLRLVVARADGTTQRCYTKDPDWNIDFLSA